MQNQNSTGLETSTEIRTGQRQAKAKARRPARAVSPHHALAATSGAGRASVSTVPSAALGGSGSRGRSIYRAVKGRLGPWGEGVPTSILEGPAGAPPAAPG